MPVTDLRESIRVAQVNLDAFFDGGAEELDYADRARDELRKALEDNPA